MRGITRASTGVLVAKRGNAKGRVLTQRVRTLSGQCQQSVVAISVNTVARSLFRDRLFNRGGNSFASTRASHTNGFRTTRRKALFLSRVNGLPCRLRSGLLATVRDQDIIQMKDGRPVPIGVHLVYTAGYGLRRVITGNGFHRSLLCHVGAVRVRVPPLQRHGRSVVPLTRHFVSQFYGRCSGKGVLLSANTRRGLQACP